MSIVANLLHVLHEEEKCLHDRQFEELEAVNARKNELLSLIETELDDKEEPQAEQLEAIRTQAEKNAHLLNIMKEATLAAQTRLVEITNRIEAVGYGQEGERLVVDGAKNSRHA